MDGTSFETVEMVAERAVPLTQAASDRTGCTIVTAMLLVRDIAEEVNVKRG